jgi:assimilatory nitrate reductase catalytic subunit
MFSQWTDPEAAFGLMKALSRGQPCDITGIRDYRMLDEAGGIQWPLPSGAGFQPAETHRRLFEDGRFYHADGRARFLFDVPSSIPEPPDDQYPLLLLTGRGTASQWHTQTRTSKSAVLRKLYPRDVYIEINPADAHLAQIKPRARVLVESRRGSLVANAVLTHAVQPGQVFVPMHYEAVNRLTLAHFDPHSRQPSYKDCAVRVCLASSADVRRVQKELSR